VKLVEFNVVWLDAADFISPLDSWELKLVWFIFPVWFIADPFVRFVSFVCILTSSAYMPSILNNKVNNKRIAKSTFLVIMIPAPRNLYYSSHDLLWNRKSFY
jgi:hypothetical protein